MSLIYFWWTKGSLNRRKTAFYVHLLCIISNNVLTLYLRVYKSATWRNTWRTCLQLSFRKVTSKFKAFIASGGTMAQSWQRTTPNSECSIADNFNFSSLMGAMSPIFHVRMMRNKPTGGSCRTWTHFCASRNFKRNGILIAVCINSQFQNLFLKHAPCQLWRVNIPRGEFRTVSKFVMSYSQHRRYRLHLQKLESCE